MSGLFDNAPVVQTMAEFGTPLWWKPRLGDRQNAAYGLLQPGQTDLHLATVHCPVCWSATLQRPASSDCTTCYGTGWQGGFAAGVLFNGFIATGTVQVQAQETGELLGVNALWLYSTPADAFILPQDLIVARDAPAVRYLAGQLTQTPGPYGGMWVRVTQLETLAPDSPWQLVPVP